MAFVVMLHLSLGQAGSARTLPQTVTMMTVQRVVATTRIAVDPVYLIAPNRLLSISGGYLASSKVCATPGLAEALGLLAASAFDMPISDTGLPETTDYVLDRYAACRARHASQREQHLLFPDKTLRHSCHARRFHRPRFAPSSHRVSHAHH